MYNFLWILLPVLIIGIVVTVLFLTRKKKVQEPEIISEIEIKVTNPVSSFAGTIKMNEKDILSMTLETLINIILQKATLPWAIDDIFWNSVQIDNTVFTAENGEILEKNQTVISLVNKIPKTVQLNFQRICRPSEKPTENICRGQQAVCGPTGWILVDGIKPPTEEEATLCCKDSPNGPIGKWDSMNSVVHCSCGEAPSTDCGDPSGCGAFSQVCTKDGWVCKSGTKCPDESKWGNCLNCDKSEYVICQDGKFSCTKCDPSTITDCEFSCHNLQENVCQQDGKFACVPNGAECPTDISLAVPCCTDPLFPIPVCDKSKGTTTCKDCEDIPKHVDDPNYAKCENGTCDGYGWVCTATGWIAQPHIKPPPNMSICCPITHIASWNPELGYVECVCATGSTCVGKFQGNEEKNFTNCQKTCCTGPQSCFETLNDCICCEDISRVCLLDDGSSVCCASGYVCVNNQCVPICGKEANGDYRGCTTCLQVDKLSAWQKNSIITNPNVLINTKTGPGGGEFGYICMGNNVCANPTQISTVPKKIPNEDPNFQPFAQFADEFCIPKDLATTPVTSCAYTDNTSCTADPNCTWRNVVQFMSQDVNNDTQLHNEIKAKYNMLDGFYCREGVTLRKAVSMQMDKNNCGEIDCWVKTANQGTTNLYYNQDTGICSMIINKPNAINSTSCKGSNCSNIAPAGSISQVNSTIPDCVTRTQDPGNFPVASCPVVNDMCVQYCLPNTIPYGICIPNSVRLEGDVKFGQVMPKKYKCDTNKQCVLSAIGMYGNQAECSSACV